MKNNKKKVSIFVILLIAVACLIVGYALLSTTLNINGTTSVKGNTWNIHWANVQVTSGSTTGNTTEAVITSPTQVEFSISLDKPGDFYEFTVDAVNEGTIDGMIDVISTNVYQSNGTTPATLPSAISYSVTYEDDTPLGQNQLLPANSTETYKVRIEYKRDISNSELLTTAETYVFKVEGRYEQADENAVSPRTYVYAFNEYSHKVCIGDSVSDLSTTTYNSLQGFVDSTGGGTRTAMRYRIINNQIVEAAACVMNNGNEVCLIGGDNGAKYEKNKQILQNAFGTSECSEIQTYDNTTYQCGTYGSIRISTEKKGYVSVQDRVVATCTVFGIGSSNGNGCSYCAVLD